MEFCQQACEFLSWLSLYWSALKIHLWAIQDPLAVVIGDLSIGLRLLSHRNWGTMYLKTVSYEAICGYVVTIYDAINYYYVISH